MNALTLPNSVASNKHPSPSIENALFIINAQVFNRIFTVRLKEYFSWPGSFWIMKRRQ